MQPGGELKLMVDGPCGQACEFCSIPGRDRPESIAPARLAALLAEVEAGRGRGCSAVRLTGIDPLTFPGILEIVGRARDLGYERLAVHSPSTRLSDPAFCEAFAGASPPGLDVNIPLYATVPEIHDRVVGRPGAHALVTSAIERLVEAAGSGAVTIATVVLATNLGEVGRVAAFARTRRFRFFCQLPFPDRDVPSDRFFSVALRQTDVARALLEGPDALPVRALMAVSGLAACVAARAVEERGGRERGALRAFLESPESRAVVPTGLRTATDPCPHAAGCALAPPCSGSVLRAYGARHGLDELAPPSTVKT